MTRRRLAVARDEAASTGTGNDVGVVLVHGIRTSRTMWRAQQEALEAAGAQVRAVDLPGHGARIDESFTVAAALDAIDEAVDELGGTAVVAGLSLGGYLAIEYAASRPEKVVALVAAGCCTSPRSVLRTAWVWLARRIESAPDSGARLNDFMVRHTLTEAGAQDVGAGGFALRVMSGALTEVGSLDPLAALSSLRCPVHLVNGRYDHFRTQERRFLGAARASGQRAELVVVPGARHLVSLDAPVAFSRVLLEVVDEARVGTLPGRTVRPPTGSGSVAGIEETPGAGPAHERG